MTLEAVTYFTLILVAVTQVSGSLTFKDVTTTSVSLQWPPGENATAANYSVTFSPAGDTTDAVSDISDCDSEQLCANLTGLTPGTTYKVNVLLGTVTSYTDDVTTNPAAPTSLNHTITDTRATVSWAAPSGLVEKYSVTIRSVTSASETVNNVNDTTHNFDVTPGEKYEVSVRSVNSQDVNSDEISTQFTVPPSPVTNIVFNATTQASIEVSWDAPTGIGDNYTVTLLAPTTGAQISRSTVPFNESGIGVLVSGVLAGDLVKVSVTVSSHGENSDPTVDEHRTKPTAVVPTNITFDQTNPDAVICTWTKPDLTVADTYDISVKSPPSGVEVTPTVQFDAASPSVTLTGVSPGQSVTLQILVVSGSESSEVAEKTFVRKPNSVSNIQFNTNDPNNIQVSWDEAGGIGEKYLLTVDTATVTPSEVAFTGGHMKAVISGLQPGEQAKVTIVVESYGVRSDTVKASTRRKPTAVDPTTINIDQTNPDAVTCTWTKPDLTVADTYDISVISPTSGVTVVTPTVSFGAAPSVTLTGVTPGQSVTIQILVVSGSVSSEVAEKTFVRKPNSVSNIQFDTNDPNNITVSWDEAGGTGEKYLLTVSPNTATVTPSQVAFSGVDRKVVITGLKPGEQAEVTIVVESDGGTSDPATATIRRKPLPVSGITLSDVNDTSASVSWTPPTGVVSGYSLTLTPSEGVTFNPAGPRYDSTVRGVQLSNLTPGQMYNVSVVVHSDQENSAAVTEQFTSKPSGVSLDVKQVSPTQVNLTWTSALASGQQVVYELFYRAVLKNASSSEQELETNETSLSLDVMPGERYEFIIRPRLSGEHYGDNTTAQMTIRPLGPGQLSILEDSIDTTSVGVKWKTIDMSKSYAMGYLVTYKPLDDKQPSVPSVTETVNVDGAEVDNVTLSNLTPGRQYQVKLWTVSQEIKSVDNTELNVTARPVLNTDLTDVTTGGKDTELLISYTVNDGDYWEFINMEKVIAEGVASKKRSESDTTMIFSALTSGTRYDINVWVSSHNIDSEKRTETFYTAPEPLKSVTASAPTQNTITLVWSSVNNQSEVHIVCETDGTLDRTVEHPQSRITYEDLQPYTEYVFQLTVEKYNKNSTSKPVSGWTLESAPSVVSSFTVTTDPRDPYTGARLTWEKPAHPRGNIFKYVVVYNGTSTEQPDKPPHIGEKVFMTNNQASQSGVLTVLKGGRHYNLTIYAENNAGRGAGRSEDHDTQTGTPYLVEPQYKPTMDPKMVTQTSVGIQFKNVFSDTNGYIRGYSVIVYEDTDKGVPLLDNILTWTKVKAGDAPWPPYYATKECQIFRSSSVCDKPQTSAVNVRRKKRDLEEVLQITFQIGVQDCQFAKEDDPCNGALLPGRKYRVLLRAHSAADTIDTQISEPFETSSSSTSPIIIGVVIALLFMFVALLAAAGWIYYKYRPCARAEKGPVERPPARPVRIQQFPNHYRFMSADADFRFCEEYECLRLTGVEQSIDEARKDYNCGKNRFANISPYDWSRIKLSMMDDVPGSDYINANYMPGHNSPREFLVCQGPLVATVDDFWRMIWEQNCTAIVMLTKLIDNGREKCVQYWPSDTNPIRYGDILVAIANETCYENFNVMELRLQKDGRTRAVRHFFYKAWPDFGVPADTESLLKFISFIRRRILKAQPICVHCSAGVGRSGTYIALDKLIQDMEAGLEYVDIYGTVHEMRRHRCLMVQTEQQYIFIHRAIRDIVEGVVRIETLQPICNTNLGYNAHHEYLVEDGKWCLEGEPRIGYRLIMEDEGVQLEMMA